MLEVKNISFSYKKGKRILSDVSLELGKGECLCLLGPNGTGKSTLLKCILNLEKAEKGQVIVDGKEIFKLSAGRRAKLVAYVSQSSMMVFPYKVEEVVLMGRVTHFKAGAAASKEDIRISREALDKLGLIDLADLYFQELSGGQKQMVLIARALAQQAKYIIMDEPTANLDYSNQIKVLMTVNKLVDEGYSILMTSHFPDHSFLARSKVVMMHGGRVMAQGPPEEIITTEKLTRLYSTPVCVTQAEINMGEQSKKTKVCIPVMDTEGEVI